MEVQTLSWTLGDRLAKARRSGKVSTQEMADELGVTRKTINNYESDRVPVRIGTLRVWALKCGVSFEWLVDLPGDPDRPPDLDVRSLRCSTRRTSNSSESALAVA